MKHTNNYKRVETMNEAIEFLKSLGYNENEKTNLQLLGYTDGSLQFTNGNLFASCGKSLIKGVNILY